MRKILSSTVLILSLIVTGCSVFDKKPCPPITICPPAPIPTPCPDPPEIPEPVPCPECPPVPTPTPCPPEKVCPPETVCPPVVKCPEGIPYPTQINGSPCWDYAPNNSLNYYMLNRDVKFKACLETTYVMVEKKSGLPIPPPVTNTTGAVLLWDVDPKCPIGGNTFIIPSKEKTYCLQTEVARAVKSIISIQGVLPSKDSPCWIYAPNNTESIKITDAKTLYASCIDNNFLTIPLINYGRNSRYLKGMVGSTPFEGCAAGVSGNPIRVSLLEPERVNSLIAWETANYYFWKVLGRIDLADGNLVEQAVNKAVSACTN